MLPLHHSRITTNFLERAGELESPTSTLARLRSTTELRPRETKLGTGGRIRTYDHCLFVRQVLWASKLTPA
jgi:hypothetical protein